MGNCQAVDAAALVIQQPSGKIDRMYWPMTASEVMKMNPGHYVSLIIPLPVSDENSDDRTVRFTRVKLLRPTDTLVLGRAYRLVTTQEVMKVLRAKKHAKMKNQPELQENHRSSCELEGGNSESYKNKAMRHEGHRQRPATINLAARSKSWRPTLQSISESSS